MLFSCKASQALGLSPVGLSPLSDPPLGSSVGLSEAWGLPPFWASSISSSSLMPAARPPKATEVVAPMAVLIGAKAMAAPTVHTPEPAAAVAEANLANPVANDIGFGWLLRDKAP